MVKIDILEMLWEWKKRSFYLYNPKRIVQYLYRHEIETSVSYLYHLRRRGFISRNWFITDKGKVEYLKLVAGKLPDDLHELYRILTKSELPKLADIKALAYAQRVSREEMIDILKELRDLGEKIRFHVDRQGALSYIIWET